MHNKFSKKNVFKETIVSANAYTVNPGHIAMMLYISSIFRRPFVYAYCGLVNVLFHESREFQLSMCILRK